MCWIIKSIKTCSYLESLLIIYILEQNLKYERKMDLPSIINCMLQLLVNSTRWYTFSENNIFITSGLNRKWRFYPKVWKLWHCQGTNAKRNIQIGWWVQKKYYTIVPNVCCCLNFDQVFCSFIPPINKQDIYNQFYELINKRLIISRISSSTFQITFRFYNWDC